MSSHTGKTARLQWRLVVGPSALVICAGELLKAGKGPLRTCRWTCGILPRSWWQTHLAGVGICARTAPDAAGVPLLHARPVVRVALGVGDQDSADAHCIEQALEQLGQSRAKPCRGRRVRRQILTLRLDRAHVEHVPVERDLSGGFLNVEQRALYAESGHRWMLLLLREGSRHVGVRQPVPPLGWLALRFPNHKSHAAITVLHRDGAGGSGVPLLGRGAGRSTPFRESHLRACRPTHTSGCSAS